ncbi:ATP phosphoribosyltransferase (ATP-PRTase) (ATP-PRT) [Entophlyctis luteolus]|nr:ATP phosphoribosyltransferase (ATP-PRTase) (ATP-PRT) [Entophlyctis luteolus]KAJ3345383.1 ATP phosphoribosyltransferase (ATP-PRTase) (ATP-PRT) [Entophlyctis luteolus]KAJ3380580.1 ATP phosphoribosyltransferase (ATP-PRTase) (ATP-PRT) [Entophlyctis sp. JEL0112]
MDEVSRQLSDRLLFAIPKKGRLNEQVLTLLTGADIQFHRKNRIDIALSTNHPIAIVFLPAADIAQFVGNGNVDIGITGQDMIAEAAANVEILLKLGFGRCKLCVQAPVSSPYKSASDLVGKRIATSFPNLTRAHFDSLESESDKGSTTIQFLSGSVEASCALGLADAIVDLVESGETMHAANLHAIETILATEAVLICNPRKHYLNPLVEKIKRRIEGVIVAQRYALCTYNVSRENLARAVQITPGKKAPTVSSLESGGWVAVSVMVLKADTANVMDQLSEIGAEDIIITDIKNYRMN